MTLAFLFPALVAVAGLVIVGLAHRDLPPRMAAFALTGAILATAATAVWSPVSTKRPSAAPALSPKDGMPASSRSPDSARPRSGR